ncbi:MAG: nucleotidyltransferase family protein, partial [Bacteroidota bacterium]
MLSLDQIATLYGEPMSLLIQCCRVHFKTDAIESLNEKIEKFGDEKLAEILKRVQLLSRLHRIRPVVYRVLLNTIAPEQFKTLLKNELHSITLKNFELAKETERIVKKLEDANVLAVPYKGVAFSKQFYGDISMRESSDIDLAIDPTSLLAIKPLLEGDGYSIAAGMEDPTKARANYYMENKDLCFDKTTITEPFHIELHWMITHPNYQAPVNLNKIDTSQMLESELAGTQLKFLEPAEHFRVTLLHHLLHDGIEYLKLLVDIAQAHARVSNASINEKVLQLEQHYNVVPIFLAIEDLFGISQVSKQKNNNPLSASIIDYCLRSTIGRYQRHRVFSLIGHYRRTLHNRVRFINNKKDKYLFQLSYLHSLIKPGLGEQQWIPLPSFLHGLYYLIRPIRILLRGK